MSNKLKTHCFIVEVQTTMPWNDAEEFIRDALSSWGGQYFPGDDEQNADPRSEIGRDDVKVMLAAHYRVARID